MRYLSIFLILITFCISLQAVAKESQSVQPDQKTMLIAERLASKNISEVIEIILKLQKECQQKSSIDVCEGVMNVMDVLHYRIDTGFDPLNNKTAAFINGLMEGVIAANQKVKLENHW